MLKERNKKPCSLPQGRNWFNPYGAYKMSSVSADVSACEKMLLATKELYEKNGFEIVIYMVCTLVSL